MAAERQPQFEASASDLCYLWSEIAATGCGVGSGGGEPDQLCTTNNGGDLPGLGRRLRSRLGRRNFHRRLLSSAAPQKETCASYHQYNGDRASKRETGVLWAWLIHGHLIGKLNRHLHTFEAMERTRRKVK